MCWQREDDGRMSQRQKKRDENPEKGKQRLVPNGPELMADVGLQCSPEG